MSNNKNNVSETVSWLMVEAPDIAPLYAQAKTLGIDLAPIFSRNGIDEHKARQYGLELEKYFYLQEEIAISARDETLKLSARPLSPGTNDFVLSSLAGCHDLPSALKRLATSYNILHGGTYNRVDVRDREIVYIIDDTNFPYTPGTDKRFIYFTIETLLIFLHAIASAIASAPVTPLLKKICCKRPPRIRPGGQLAFWQAPVRYGASTYSLHYDISATEIACNGTVRGELVARTVYREVQRLITERLDPDVQHDELILQVKNAIRNGLQSQEQIADLLGTSVATLRRKLQQRDFTFRRLKGEVLDSSAKQLLSQGHTLTDVADKLGFADFRSFTRAFKQWNGLTPAAYLRQH